MLQILSVSSCYRKKVVRLLFGAKRLDHTSRLFYNLRFLNVTYIVELNIGIIMFKAYHNLLPTNLNSYPVSMNLFLQFDKHFTSTQKN